MRRVFILSVAALIFAAVVSTLNAQPYKGPQTSKVYAVPDRQQVEENFSLVLSDYCPYPITDANPASIPALTKAPKGYKPFYISHYGRHGSRWLISTRTYTEPVFFLQKAREAGVLTAQGEEVLKKLEVVEAAARGRYGELTRLGAQQHREIAGRMYKNFPEVFKKNANIDARSTVIIRCILSMEAACMRFKELNPTLNITNDASYHDMYYMNNQDPDGFFNKITSSEENRELMLSFRHKTIHGQRLAAALLKDTSFFKTFNEKYAYKDNPEKVRKYKADYLVYDVGEIAISLPNTDLDISLFEYVTLDELYNMNLYRNVSSYRYAGFSDMGQRVTPFRQTYLLKNIIKTADSVINAVGTTGKVCGGATLRFGHDSNLLPLCSLMNIDGAGVYETNMDNLANVWDMNHYIPKAGNLQFIFYGKKDAPVLIKVLLNEHEATLPVETDNFPYYEWEKVKAFYQNILSQSPLK